MASKKSKSWNGFEAGDTVHFNSRHGHPLSGECVEILDQLSAPYVMRVQVPGEVGPPRIVKDDQVRGGNGAKRDG